MTNQSTLPNQQPQIQKPKKSKKIIIILIIVLVVVLGFAGLTKAGFIPNYFNITFLCSQNDEPKFYPYFPENPEPGMDYKPVIYLYPQQSQIIKVLLNYKGGLSVSYPDYKNGWNVTAYPDGKIVNLADNKEYSYLFWEGKNNSVVNYDLSSGFVVEGKNTIDFLQTKLKELGLTAKEYNEFIVYWYPRMMNNNYNLIHFATKEEYNDRAVLEITPKPDSMLRVFMVFKKLDEKIQINPQEIKSFERKGFTVVEWGGTEIK